MCLNFDGADDVITLALGNTGFAFGPGTIAVIVKQDGTTAQTIMQVGSATSGNTRYGINTSGTSILRAQCGTTLATAPTITIDPADGWVLYAVSKASGNVAIRFHKYIFSTGTWEHEDDNITVGNSGVPTTSVSLGNTPGSTTEALDGEFAMAGVWNHALTDAEIESLPHSLSAWYQQDPAGLWLLDQDATTQLVLDHTGGGANESARTGTAISGHPHPPWSYGIEVVHVDDPAGAAQVTDDLTNSANSTQTITDAEAESPSQGGSGTPSVSEATAETVSNSASSSQTITDIDGDEQGNEGQGTQVISEATAEAVTNSASSTQTIDEAIAEILSNTQINTPSITEPSQETEDSGNEGQNTPTISEVIAESPTTESTNTPIVLSADAEATNNQGITSFSVADAMSEFIMNEQEMLASLVEQLQMAYVPVGDISAGTWTVEPLYEKVDELGFVGGYPTESIESGDNPSNDTAVLDLPNITDPQVDTNHYINIEFYKVDTMGGNQVDFTVNLKENTTIIATRTFTDVTETAASPRRERITLLEAEVANITNYNNLRIELIANEVP